MGTTKEKLGTAVRKPRAAKAHPTHEEISRRAYELYLERGGNGGNPLHDWTQAEQELIAKRGKTRKKPALKTEAAA